MVNLAVDERDYATNNFLQWFVAEQVEEEASASSVLEKFKLIGKDKSGLFAIDLELAKRVFTPPPGPVVTVKTSNNQRPP